MRLLFLDFLFEIEYFAFVEMHSTKSAIVTQRLSACRKIPIVSLSTSQVQMQEKQHFRKDVYPSSNQAPYYQEEFWNSTAERGTPMTEKIRNFMRDKYEIMQSFGEKNNDKFKKRVDEKMLNKPHPYERMLKKEKMFKTPLGPQQKLFF
uniref:Uncharacterized protein n=1 Tax=Acrobeloides nanus TaxID=290746 RepID=A0A914CCN3_9BILA